MFVDEHDIQFNHSLIPDNDLRNVIYNVIYIRLSICLDDACQVCLKYKINCGMLSDYAGRIDLDWELKLILLIV